MSSSNVLHGPATLYLDGSSLGWTQGGLRLRTVKDIWVRPSLYGVGGKEPVLLDEQFIISTYLAESTLGNLKAGLGLNSSDVASDVASLVYFGGGSDIETYELEFIGMAPGSTTAASKERKVHFWKAFAAEFGEMLTAKDRNTVIPCSFQCLLDESQPQKRKLGYIRDEK